MNNSAHSIKEIIDELLLKHPKTTGTEIMRVILEFEMNSYDNDPADDIKSMKELAINRGVDWNAQFSKYWHDVTLFEYFFEKGEFNILDTALKSNPTLRASSDSYIYGIVRNSCKIEYICNLLKRFPNDFDAQEVYGHLRAEGCSHTESHSLIDIYNITKDLMTCKETGVNHLLSTIEISLLDPSLSTLPIASYNDDTIYLNNTYGFSLLTLALLGNKYDLAIQLIETGHDPVASSNHGLTPLALLSDLDLTLPQYGTLLSTTFQHVKNVDIILGSDGESLADMFLHDDSLIDAIIERSNDPLFAFFKKSADLFALSKCIEKTYIAITDGDAFWSLGMQACSRLICNKHPNVEFRLVTHEMMERGGDEFFKQFDGWINPGAGDSYPRDMEKFSKQDWEQSFSIEKAAQLALDKTMQFKIPILGMCAGAQNLVLYHGGHLSPLDGYSYGQHEISYIQGSLAHFMAMSKEQQHIALTKGEFPEIQFNGDTAHCYAAVPNQLGEQIQLGAISEDGVPMSYAHENGLRYATQFHPEHYYMAQPVGDAHTYENNWIDNFVELAERHHDYRLGVGEHPEVYMANVSMRLHEFSQTDHSIFCHDVLLEQNPLVSEFLI